MTGENGDNGPERPIKRLKTIKACAQCTTAKTRCDDHTSTGCGRCVKLNKACSLKDDLAYLARSVGRISSPSSSPYANDTTPSRLTELENKVKYLEAHIAQLSSSAPNAHPFVSHAIGDGRSGLQAGHEALRGPHDSQSSNAAHGYMPPDYDFVSMIDFKEKGAQRRPIEERSGAVVDIRGFPDIVKRGLLSSAQISEAFLQWKHRFSTVTPLAPFLLTCSRLPSHPFVVAAIVCQTTFGKTPGVVETVNEGFARLMSGDVNMDAMLGLLVLAIDGHRNSPLLPSPIRLTAAAYDIGKAAGMEAWAQRYVRMDQVQRMSWSLQKYEELLLWETVKQYYNVLHLHYTRISSILPAIGLSQLQPPSQHYQPVLSHLALLEQTHSCFLTFLDLLVDLEYRATYSSPDVTALHDAWRVVLMRIAELDPVLAAGHPSQLFVHSTLISVAHRVLSLIHLIPTPTHPALLAPPIDAWGTEVCHLSTRLINIFLDWDDESCPVIPHIYVGRILGAVVMFSFAHITTLRHVPAWLGANMELAQRGEDKLMSMGGIAECGIRRVREAFGAKPGERIAWPGVTDVEEEGFGGGITGDELGLDGLNGTELDLSAWSWLFEGVGV